jgi:hypothetical protein
MSSDYRTFLAGKRSYAPEVGFEAKVENPHPFDWQRAVIEWSIRKGRCALFEDCGLGKTLQHLLWAEAVVRHTGGRVLILCPPVVAQQEQSEAEKFGIEVPVKICRDQSDVGEGISLTNYQRLHLFDPSAFAGVVLGESSILKNYTGKTKQRLMEAFRSTPYRLCETATPAPNDLLELGNHADFLGVMPANEMLARWFINDASEAGNYRLKGHAAEDFWRWVASWAVCASKPSDLGDYSDDGYVLPPLTIEEHILANENTGPPPGWMFKVESEPISATEIHRQKRTTAAKRAEFVAGLVRSKPTPWVVWCDTDYEQDELMSRLKGVEVRGKQDDDAQERSLVAFAAGEARVMVTKPSIAGFGVNWQHCPNAAFVGLSYSFERFYQAVRRTWRFGQTRPVTVHVVATEAERGIGEVVAAKGRTHELMRCEMAAAMRSFQQAELHGRRKLSTYCPQKPMTLPAWLVSKTEAA